MKSKRKRYPKALPSTSSEQSLLCVPAEVRRRGTSLLNLQGWCWGRDICRPNGNLLLAYGFDRHRPPTGKLGSSAYSLKLGAARSVVLWGFGLLYNDPANGAVYLPRCGFAPQLTSSVELPATIWEMAQLPSMQTPVASAEWRSLFALISAALTWIAGYEQWVVASVGIEYRSRCVTEWKRSRLAATEIAANWQQLAAVCDQRGELIRKNALRPTEWSESLP